MGLSLSSKMNRERFPTSGAGASAKALRFDPRRNPRARPLLRGKEPEPQPGRAAGLLGGRFLQRAIGPEA